MSSPREERRKTGGNTATPPLLHTQTPPRGVEMKDETKTEAELKHQEPHDGSQTLGGGRGEGGEKIIFKSAVGKKKELWKTGDTASASVMPYRRTSSLRASTDILLGNPDYS